MPLADTYHQPAIQQRVHVARTAHVNGCCQTASAHTFRGQPLQQPLSAFLLDLLRFAQCPGHQRLQVGHRAVWQRALFALQSGCDNGEQRPAQYMAHHARLTTYSRSVPAEPVDQRRCLILCQLRHGAADRLVHPQAGTGCEQDAPALPCRSRDPAEALIQQFLAADLAGLIQAVHHQSNTTCCRITEGTCRLDRRVDHTTLNVLGTKVNRNRGPPIAAGRSDVLLVLPLCRQRLTRPEGTLQDHYTLFGRGDHRRGKRPQEWGIGERARRI
ncbi:hypothetical protein AB0O51_26900 [Streptomyces sp. NPDC090301]|uniref:hypothetical protein n=1 Tax=Streptomyces sp. NPDC090301 TaxID=3154975 RepID=UPI003442DCF0